jgi:ribonucleotide reductase beta subunit family protein with ferritin-like domain
MDHVAATLYDRLEHYVGRLSADSDEDEFLAAVVVYHLIAEGVIARTAQNLAAGQYERLAFPGLAEGQRLVARDEARHIGIGVSYTRRRMEESPQRARLVIGEVVEDLFSIAATLLGTAKERMGELVLAGYGVEPQDFYNEVMRLTRLRLRSVGFLD